MKQTTIVAVLAITALIAAGLAFAQMGAGGSSGTGYPYSIMGKTGNNPGTSINEQNLKKFQKETLSLRDDLFNKRAELANEYNKPIIDMERIIELRHQIADIQAEIHNAAAKYGLPAHDWGQILKYGYYMGIPT